MLVAPPAPSTFPTEPRQREISPHPHAAVTQTNIQPVAQFLTARRAETHRVHGDSPAVYLVRYALWVPFEFAVVRLTLLVKGVTWPSCPLPSAEQHSSVAGQSRSPA